MKKLIILAIILSAITGFAAAGGLVFQVGAGYASSYVGELPSDIPAGADTLKSMPFGVGGYAGLGYGFGDKKMFSIGGEFAPAWTLSFDPWGVSNLSYQIRGFVKFKLAGLLTITGFSGYEGGTLIGGDLSDPFKSGGNAAIGFRITVLFIYAEYAAVMPWDFSSVYKNNIGIGFAFFQ